MSTVEQQPSPPIASRRDQLSFWSVALIIVYFILQGMTMAGITPAFKKHKALPASTPPARSALDSDSGFRSLFEIDYQAKTIYVADHLESLLGAPDFPSPSSSKKAPLSPKTAPLSPKKALPSPAPKPAPAAAAPSSALLGPKGAKQPTLSDIAGQAVAALRKDPMDIDFARRVILLRAEAGMPPLAPIPPKGKIPGLNSPLASYAPDKNTPAVLQGQLNAEAALWKELFSTQAVPKGTDTAKLAKQITSIQSLRWYKQLALHQLYLRSGYSGMASRAQDKAVNDALISEIPLFVILLGMLGLLFLGGGLFLALVIANLIARRAGLEQSATKPTLVGWLVRLSQPRQGPIAQEDRRLGAGDLMDVFVFYLFSAIAIGYLFEYLISRPFFHRALAGLSYNNAIKFEIVAESFAYVLNGLLAYWLLAYIAKRRKASIAAELGLTTNRLARNVFFGVAGWSIGLALTSVIAGMSSKVFQGAPEPTNPAVKLEVGSTGFLSHFLLFALASIAAPFFEELLFRGVFFQAARLKLGPWPAILLTGLVFGFAHPVGAGQALALSTLGAVFAWMAYTRKSLVPSMTGHFLQNTFASLMMWLAFLIIPPG